MGIEVHEGQLTEAPTTDADGVERRAAGEFVGPRGELASYAFGWTTGTTDRIARLTVGIGAGNPGGGSFHAMVVADGDSHGFALVDEPFARVPEGGPDLTAEQARAHIDLPFIWWVADLVMQRDRRAWWMRHWLLGTTCLQTPEVFDHHEPTLRVDHDAETGVWKLVGTSEADHRTARTTHLHHVVDDDPTLIDVLALPAGHIARRTAAGQPWSSSHSATLH